MTGMRNDVVDDAESIEAGVEVQESYSADVGAAYGLCGPLHHLCDSARQEFAQFAPDPGLVVLPRDIHEKSQDLTVAVQGEGK